jgi:DGC domain.
MNSVKHHYILIKDKTMECCEKKNETEIEKEYEIIHLAKTKKVCPMCENFSRQQASKSVAVVSCEGACLRGEVSRQTANLICYSLAKDKTVRICLGGAFTKDTGQRNLVRNAPKVLILEGCFINCASRMMQGVVADLKPEVVIVDRLYEFDTKLFGIDEMSHEEIMQHSKTAANKILATL